MTRLAPLLPGQPRRLDPWELLPCPHAASWWRAVHDGRWVRCLGCYCRRHCKVQHVPWPERTNNRCERCGARGPLLR